MKKMKQTNASAIIIIASALVLVAVIFGVMYNAEVIQKTTETTTVVEEEGHRGYDLGLQDEETEAIQIPETVYRYYNLELQDDGIKDNNFNFGHNPYEAAEAEYKESDGDKNVFILKYILSNFEARMTPGENGDPAFMAAHAAYMDAVLGTRTMGSFYDEVDKNWSLAINNARNTYETNSQEWELAAEKYKKTLQAANGTTYLIEVNGKTDAFVVNGKKYTVTDQMYMFPLSSDLRPDVIVMTQDEDNSDANYHVLMYALNIKRHEYVLMYKVECGFQPLNVLNVMKVEPTKKSDTTDEELGGNTNPTDEELGGNTNHNHVGKCVPPDSALSGNKAAPSGAGKGDTKDAGANTNNGKGATESNVEAEDNSTDYNYSEYVKKVEELADQTGNDPTPSVEGEAAVVEQEVNSQPIPQKTETLVNDNNNQTTAAVSNGDAGPPVF